jgi:hypothetical protein
MTERRSYQMIRSSLQGVSLAAIVAVAATLPVAAQENVVTDTHQPDQATSEQIFKAPGYSPYAGRNFPTQVFWGNQHMHTAVSLDAGAIGTKLGPEEAYRLARGEEITTSTGQPIKLSRPMDWLLVSDHAEAIGAIAGIIGDNPTLMADATVKRWHDMIKAGGKNAFDAAWEMIKAMGAHKVPAVLTDRAFQKTIWDKQIQIAEKYNEPGRFTAFLGYEWTSMPGGDNTHRNVVFRDGADKVGQVLPFSALDSENPEDLWKVLASYEEKTGGQALAIPHNPNISGGRMFAVEDFTGNPFTAAYVEARARWEPLLEVIQVKGDSESHPFLSPTDEFSGYAAWDKMNLGATKLHQDEWFKSEYAREALKTGLKLEQDLGTNPFKFGLVGGTDQHIGITAIEEENYFGQTPMDEPKADRAMGVFSHINDVKVMNWEEGAAGYAAIWATENTREALWDAMKRKEVYATTGSRMIVRFFGGWDFESSDALSRLPAETGYTKGVPMGGDLRAAPDGKVPTFLVAALKDPIGANLDRVQIIKGWLDAKGETQEKIYDVAWGDADTRQPGADGKVPTVGNTVDVANATWTNTIGDPELITVWKDPDFDPKLKAFYYARVIEIPVPRWTAYDAKRFNITLPPEVPMTTTERAYTSPIWYTP